jgi:hypothetical protein
MSRTALNQKESLLLRLPAEIRDKVYEYVHSAYEICVFYCPYEREQRFEAYTSDRPPKRPANLIGLLRTCRQLHLETERLLFIHCPFDILLSGSSS